MQKIHYPIWIFTILYVLVLFVIGVQVWGDNSIVAQWIDDVNIAVRDVRQNLFPYFNFPIDDYIQFIPGVLVLGLLFSNYKGAMPNKKFVLFIFIAVAITQITVQLLKIVAGEERPDQSDSLSFPSGHTATVFMIATILAIQYDIRSRWYSIFGYACAIIVACMRILNNRHWVFDVVIGAALGIILTYVAYLITSRIINNKITHNNN